MAKPCSTRVSTLNIVLYTLLCDEKSVHSLLFRACIPRPIRPVTMKKTLMRKI